MEQSALCTAYCLLGSCSAWFPYAGLLEQDISLPIKLTGGRICSSFSLNFATELPIPLEKVIK